MSNADEKNSEDVVEVTFRAAEHQSSEADILDAVAGILDVVAGILVDNAERDGTIAGRESEIEPSEPEGPPPCAGGARIDTDPSITLKEESS